MASRGSTCFGIGFPQCIATAGRGRRRAVRCASPGSSGIARTPGRPALIGSPGRWRHERRARPPPDLPRPRVGALHHGRVWRDGLDEATDDLSGPATANAGRWPRNGSALIRPAVTGVADERDPAPLSGRCDRRCRARDRRRQPAHPAGGADRVRQDHRRRRDHPALRAPLSPGAGAGASAGDHHADQRQAACPQHCARHHQGRIRAATDGAGAARFGADAVGARHALARRCGCRPPIW